MLNDLLRGRMRDITPKNRPTCFQGMGGGVIVIEHHTGVSGEYLMLNGEKSPNFYTTSDDDRAMDSKEWYEKILAVANQPWIFYRVHDTGSETSRYILGDGNGITIYADYISVNSNYIYNRD